MGTGAAGAPRSPVGVFLDLVLPRPCPGCGGPEPWCRGCAAVLAARPRQVMLPDATLDAAAGLALPPARAITRYRGAVRSAIIAGKERGRSDLPPLLGGEVGRALLRMRRMRLDGLGVGGSPLWIVPAPSRRAAARRRGGDPVTAMAFAAAAVVASAGWEAGVAGCLLTSSRARDSVGLDAASRSANVSGRVRFRSAAAPPAGSAVVLLDDVLTSGATMVESVRVLAAHGIEVRSMLAVASAAPWRGGRR